jgi:TM2 domain-containing membrane protein YozV
MHINDEDMSQKNQIVALMLCVLFGNLGIHRFYVGKYITGAILLVVGGTSIVAKVLGFGYAFIAIIASFIVLALDVYALYSDSFTDGKGKLVIGCEKNLVYNTLEEREQKLFVSKLDKIMCIMFGIAAYILYYVLINVVF